MARPSPPVPALPGPSRGRLRLYEVIFEADTPAGRAYDLLLSGAILVSVAVVMLESVASITARHGPLLRALEWGFTFLFTVEYVLRLVAVPRAWVYARSFFGIVDLFAVLPTWLSLLVPGGQYLLTVRLLRLLRVFRILKLTTYLAEADMLRRALKASSRKISVFLVTVSILIVLVGSLMYVIEGEASGFTSLPKSIYWAVVTLTTVGYGDIAPRTPLGQFLASAVMIVGYAIIAVPTGIVTVELNRTRPATAQVCPGCLAEGHDVDAVHCKFCGTRL